MTTTPAAERVTGWLGAAGDHDLAALDDPGRAAAVLAAAIRAGVLDLPLPGGGRTWERFDALAAVAAADLTLARLAEAHTDALAILAELGGPAPAAGDCWGVWAAEPPDVRLDAVATAAGSWTLRGTKAWCSGAHACTHALVTASTPAGSRLFAVPLRCSEVRPESGGWHAVGMAGSDSQRVRFAGAAAVPVGAAGDYTGRVGFWSGAVGVAACWYGGAVGLAGTLLAAAGRRDVGPHALAHLGAVDAALVGARAVLREAADEIDAGLGGGERRAFRARAVVEAAATEVIDRVGRALGPGPLATDRRHARRAADLPIYLRQSHAERDLARLGTLVADPADKGGPGW